MMQFGNFFCTFQTDPVTFNVGMNLKVTKKFYKERIELAFFVNQLLSYWHEYRGSNGVLVRQTTPMPYFGMEINFNL